MNEIIEKTRELGELIQNSEEMKNAKNAEILQENDDEAQALLKEFNLQRMNLARDMQNNKISREEAIQKNNEAFEEMLEKSESIKKYIAKFCQISQSHIILRACQCIGKTGAIYIKRKMIFPADFAENC